MKLRSCKLLFAQAGEIIVEYAIVAAVVVAIFVAVLKLAGPSALFSWTENAKRAFLITIDGDAGDRALWSELRGR